jgi:hypothetical protein
MNLKAMTLCGIVFLAIGVGTLIHPRFSGPAHRRDVVALDRHVTIETRRVFPFRPFLSGAFLLAGGIFVYLGTRRA